MSLRPWLERRPREGDDAFARELGAELVDWRFKGAPVGPPVTVDALGEQGLNVVAGDLPTPLVTLRHSAVEHNVLTMAAFCQDSGALLAPHAKTSMSPQLCWRQLRAGAWGTTAATLAQVRALRAFGLPRIILANQLVEPVALRWIAAELADPEFDFYCLVDSVAAVAAMHAVLIHAAPPRPVQVLLEIGYPGGRAGCRSIEDAIEVGTALRASEHLLLRGVEGFEGYVGEDASHDTLAAVDDFLDRMAAVAQVLVEKRLLDGDVVLSAGGSTFFDRVVERLGGVALGDRPVKLVLRSGCYVTHDSGLYRRLSPLDGRRTQPTQAALVPALELWGVVLSRPEPDLAIANFGKRDTGHDADLPVVHAVVRGSRWQPLRDEQLVVRLLHDQHAHIELPDDFPLEVGDLVVCGISHPCTTFDKWRLIPLIDDEFNVVSAIHTFF